MHGLVASTHGHLGSLERSINFALKMDSGKSQSIVSRVRSFADQIGVENIGLASKVSVDTFSMLVQVRCMFASSPGEINAN